MKPKPADDFREVVGPEIIYFLSGCWQPSTLVEIAQYVHRDLTLTASYCEQLEQAGKIKKVSTVAGFGFILLD